MARHRLIHGALLVVVLATALGLRVWRLDAYPGGLSHDEAYDALNAVEVLRGARPVFFEANNGREALYMYLVAASFGLGGVGPVQLRIVSALAGLLAVVLLYVLARRMLDRRVALLATALMGVSFWPLFDSRVGLRAALLPALACLMIYGLWRWAQALSARAHGPALAWAAFAGGALGLGLQTYTPARFLPLVPVLFAAYLVGSRSARPREAIVGVLATAGVAAIVFAPLGLYFAANPGSFAGRAGQVNDLRFIVRDGNFRPLIEDTLNTLGMFGVRGDPFMRYNLADRPVFDPLSAALFYLGVIVCAAWLVARLGRRLAVDRAGLFAPGAEPRAAAALLVIWLGVALLPSATTGESPHFLRAIAAQPVVFVFPALGFFALVERLRQSGRVPGPAWVGALAGALTVGTLALAARDYFVVWPAAPEARRIYNTAYAPVAERLEPDGTRTFVAAEYPADLDRFVVDVWRGLRPAAATWFDGRVSAVYPAAGPARYLIPRSVRPPEPLLDRLYPSDAYGSSELWDGRVEHPEPPPPEKASDARLDRYLELVGIDVPADVSAGEIARVVLHWRIVEPTPRDLAFFVHVIGARGSLWGQNDGLGYPVDQWRAGDRLVQWHDVAIPAGAPPVTYQVEAGAYWRDSGERLVVNGRGEGSDRIRLGSIAVTRPAPGEAAAPTLVAATPVGVSFGEAVRLQAAELPPEPVRPGSTVRVVLYWRAAAPLGTDYTVFNHLVGGEPRPVAQADGPPAYGAFPTSAWQPGDLVRDPHEMVIPADLPPGRYELLTGLYLPSTGARLAPEAPGSGPLDMLARAAARAGLRFGTPRVEGDRVVLATIEVRGE